MNNSFMTISNESKLSTHRATIQCYSITDKYINPFSLDKLGRNKNE